MGCERLPFLKFFQRVAGTTEDALISLRRSWVRRIEMDSCAEFHGEMVVAVQRQAWPEVGVYGFDELFHLCACGIRFAYVYPADAFAQHQFNQPGLAIHGFGECYTNDFKGISHRTRLLSLLSSRRGLPRCAPSRISVPPYYLWPRQCLCQGCCTHAELRGGALSPPRMRAVNC